ncbi:amino-acid N-acetyltransferase, partial [Klebsiella pneumoniae]|nr:amino-acid N-acetyltransferase [Klebsiella pneumoniae]
SVAVSLQAEKLVYLTLSDGISRPDGTLAVTLSAQEAQSLAEHAGGETRRLISSTVAALEGGVHRVQILNGAADGSLLQELFTRNGIGTSIAKEAFVSIRQAHSGDIPHIAALIRPLEEQGILLHRSREYLENHISEFSILEHDGNLYGCAALKTF